MSRHVSHTFSAELWMHASPGAWVFVTVPRELSQEIRSHAGWMEEGWGRLKARARIGSQTWDTALWFDRNADAYLLPVRAGIRKQEGLLPGDLVEVTIWV